MCPPRPNPLPSFLLALLLLLPRSPRSSRSFVLFIHIYLASGLFFLPLSLPPSGSPLSPRSGASGAPPLARRDVARGDVDAAVSGALDVCVQPGPGLQSRRRPLRCLLEQQQPQVRWPGWGRRELGLRGPGPGAGSSGGPGAARTSRRQRAPSEPASPDAAGCRAPAGSARSAPLFVKLRRQDRLAAARNPQGCAEPLPPRGCWEGSEMGGSRGPGTSLASRGRLACTSRIPAQGLGLGKALGAYRREFAPGAWGRKTGAENLLNIKVFIYLFEFKHNSFFFPCARRERTG